VRCLGLRFPAQEEPGPSRDESLDVSHDDVGDPVGFAGVVDRDHVWIVDARGGAARGRRSA